MHDVNVWTREQIAPGMHDRLDFTVSAADMRAFAELSGDYNPLHTDAAFAHAKGFTGVVVYGALLVAKLSNVIGMKLPGRDSVWVSFALQFHEPLFLDEPAWVEAEVSAVSAATGLVSLRLAVRAGDRQLAKGKAEVMLVAS